MSRCISPSTYGAAYELFTPNESEQRLLPPYYRGCWHGVSRSFLWWYCQATRVLAEWYFIPPDRVYGPRTFITHATSLGQGFPHCRSLSTATSRRSLGRISVPVWPTTLSSRLPIVALVSRYLTNKLIGRGTIFRRKLETEASFNPRTCDRGRYAVLAAR